MVSNDDKRQNGKGGIAYLFLDLMTKVANGGRRHLVANIIT